MPPTPNSVRVSVIVLTSVATSAHITAAADASSAVRRTTVLRMPRRARIAAAPTVPHAPVAQALLSGYCVPPCGSDMARNTLRETQVSAAAHQVTPRMG
jgi:hypothetical protein